LRDTWIESHPPNYGNLSYTLYGWKEDQLSILVNKAGRSREELERSIQKIAQRHEMWHFVPSRPWPPSTWDKDVKKCIELTRWLAASFIFDEELSLQKHIFRYIWGFSRDEDFSLLGSSSASGTQTLSPVSQPEISSDQSR
jgi:hypothetical protein